MGDFDSIEVIEIINKKGNQVKKEEGLITLETDKASMDVPSPEDGIIESISINVGDFVKQGDCIGTLKVNGSEVKTGSEKIKTVEKKIETKNEIPISSKKVNQSPTNRNELESSTLNGLPKIDEDFFSKAHASPSIRKFARELGVNLIEVKGTGYKSRILKDDIKAFVKSILSGFSKSSVGLPKIPSLDYAKYGEVSNQSLTKIQKISGQRLQASWINLPHVTQHDLADVTEMEADRLKIKKLKQYRDIKISPLAYVIKACSSVLKDFEKINSSLSEDGNSIILKNFINIGFAADTENGLVVPVIKDADKKSLIEIAEELLSLSLKARAGKLSSDEMSGATFTISSLGGIGGTAFTPIINAPEVAILGLSRSTTQPVWNGSEFEPKLMLPLSFSYDHRVIDGAYAVRFTTALCDALKKARNLSKKA